MVPSSAFSMPELQAVSMPRHVAIIMDGNGRWAKARGLNRAAGHKKGAEALHALLNSAHELGLEYLTIYAFSSENWKRPENEISDLMLLLRHYLRHEVKTLHTNGVCLKIIGDRTQLAADIRTEIEHAEALTACNTRFHLNVALSYGSRQEIARAFQALAREVEAGKRDAASITEKIIADTLDTAGLPDPDLLIRTGGDQRLSNFLLWQSAYTELYFTPVLWPDFTAQHLKDAIHDYARRERRYGNASE